jgi:thiol-disulfide isomerase/thioredoxin
VALAAVVLLLGACGREQPASALVGVESISTDEREPLPRIAGSTLDGGTLDLADLRGRVVVLNSWASWCEPCREEVPSFVDLDERSDPDKVAVVGLDVNDQSAAADAFASELGIQYPSIVDPDGSLLRTIPGVPPSSLPSTVILDPQGRVAVRVIGATDPVELAGLVEALVQEGSGQTG